jgi:hypothetical protein
VSVGLHQLSQGAANSFGWFLFHERIGDTTEGGVTLTQSDDGESEHRDSVAWKAGAPLVERKGAPSPP